MANQQRKIACIVGVGLAVVALLSYFGVRNLRICHRQAIGRMVTTALEEHLEDGNEWPKNWEELSAVSDVSVAVAKECLIVDFGCNTADLAQQSAENFRAIQPNGPCPGYREYWGVSDLLQAIRRAQEAKVMLTEQSLPPLAPADVHSPSTRLPAHLSDAFPRVGIINTKLIRKGEGIGAYGYELIDFDGARQWTIDWNAVDELLGERKGDCVIVIWWPASSANHELTNEIEAMAASLIKWRERVILIGDHFRFEANSSQICAMGTSSVPAELRDGQFFSGTKFVGVGETGLKNVNQVEGLFLAIPGLRVGDKTDEKTLQAYAELFKIDPEKIKLCPMITKQAGIQKRPRQIPRP